MGAKLSFLRKLNVQWEKSWANRHNTKTLDRWMYYKEGNKRKPCCWGKAAYLGCFHERGREVFQTGEVRQKIISNFSLFLFFFFPSACSLQDLSSPTREWTQGPGRGSVPWSLNHWTTREFPDVSNFLWVMVKNVFCHVQTPTPAPSLVGIEYVSICNFCT